MAVRIISDDRNAVLYCSTEDVAFGPVFNGVDAQEQAEDFLAWLPEDARTYQNAGTLIGKYGEWCRLAFSDSDDFTPVAVAA